MKKYGVKYLVLAMVFIIGISIGDLRKDVVGDIKDDPVRDELILSLEDMNENFFVRLAKLMEKGIKYIFYLVFMVFGKVVKLIFGMWKYAFYVNKMHFFLLF